MKKKLFTLLAALLCGTFTSFAQPAAKTKRLTAKAGITYPMIHDMDVRGSQGTKSQGTGTVVPYNSNISTMKWKLKSDSDFLRIIWSLQNKYITLQLENVSP